MKVLLQLKVNRTFIPHAGRASIANVILQGVHRTKKIHSIRLYHHQTLKFNKRRLNARRLNVRVKTLRRWIRRILMRIKNKALNRNFGARDLEMLIANFLLQVREFLFLICVKKTASLKILVLRVINSSRHRNCFVRDYIHSWFVSKALTRTYLARSGFHTNNS